jgi:uncharacterized protein
MLATADQDPRDAGPNKGPARERFCVLTREVKPVADLIRFVVGPDGAVVPDVKRNLPGRGLWVTNSADAVGQTVRRKLFERGFKRDVQSGPELIAQTGELLEKSALDALSIAGKAGEVITGFAKVEAAIGRGGLAALLHAADGSPDGIRKIEALLRRDSRETAEDPAPEGALETPVLRIFSGAQLDLALGRSNVIHAALLAGPASQGFLTRCQRLMRYRTGETSRPAPHRASGDEPNGPESGTESE